MKQEYIIKLIAKEFSMLKSRLFDQTVNRIKEYLPDLAVREKVQKILQEYDIVTQQELETQLKHIENLRTELKSLAIRVEQLEKNKQ